MRFAPDDYRGHENWERREKSRGNRRRVGASDPCPGLSWLPRLLKMGYVLLGLWIESYGRYGKKGLDAVEDQRATLVALSP